MKRKEILTNYKEMHNKQYNHISQHKYTKYAK